MCQVRILERAHSCQVTCQCGYEALLLSAPDQCPLCHGSWAHPCFEEPCLAAV